jgi:hypothetical protein
LQAGLRPEHINDPLSGQDLIGMKQKQADKHFLAVPAELEPAVLAADANGTENPEVHGAPS